MRLIVKTTEVQCQVRVEYEASDSHVPLRVNDVGGLQPKILHSPTTGLHIKRMKPFFSKMLRMHKTLDVVTLFHKPSVQSSMRILTLLKQASAQAQEHATEDQASDHRHQHSRRDPFELNVTEDPPTKDQLRTILEYSGGAKAAQLVKGASSMSDAFQKLKDNPDSFLRPVVCSKVQSAPIQGHRYVTDPGIGRGLEPEQSR